jgi:hypothetical protein
LNTWYNKRAHDKNLQTATQIGQQKKNKGSNLPGVEQFSRGIYDHLFVLFARLSWCKGVVHANPVGSTQEMRLIEYLHLYNKRVGLKDFRSQISQDQEPPRAVNRPQRNPVVSIGIQNNVSEEYEKREFRILALKKTGFCFAVLVLRKKN